ncbi:MAG: hypothetical protein GY847_38690 [Proteobacteria bacterium]|nr:hypothetical protein [Pseudomonadota bacterium]
MQELISINGKMPLDYKAFVDSELETNRSFKRLQWKTKGRLVVLFEKGQSFFGSKIVELAGLEDLDPTVL